MSQHSLRRALPRSATTRAAAAALGLGLMTLVPAVHAAASLPAVSPVTSCTSLLAMDWTGITGAPTKLNTAAEVTLNNANYCKVTGYVAPKVRFEMYMPVAGWTGRYQFSGSGGYAGSVSGSGNALLSTAPLFAPNQTSGFPLASTNEFVVVTTDLGHARSQSQFADGFWALDDPTAIVDFAYTGVHKAVVASKAIVKGYYGQQPQYAYYSGCSDGGREGLHELQRYPDDFDGAIIGAPVIDEIATNTQWHAHFWRSNLDSAGSNVLLASKRQILSDAVRAACGTRLNDGSYDVPSDFRSCRFDARSIASASCDPASATNGCVTPAQAEVANRWWAGPVADGQHLTPGGVPYGSEIYWGLPATPTTSVTTLGDYIFSNDFPNVMGSFDAPTGITGRNMQFTTKEFQRLHELTGVYDPTNPDLSAFRRRGGKVLFWSGWADSGASPYMVLNYFDALTQQMGTRQRDSFTKLYLLPGAGHCAGRTDLYSPLLAWVEQGQTPSVVQASNLGPAVRDRPVWPHPALTVYDPGSDSFVKGGTSKNSDRYDWIGLRHYTSEHTVWCKTDGDSKKQKSSWGMTCDANSGQHR
jgi:Tannase and feruloyl esterase